MKKTSMIVGILLVVTLMIIVGCEKTPVESQTTVNDSIETEDLSSTLDEIEYYYLEGDNLYITKDGARVEDMVIKGNVYVEESLGDGEFYIENCDIEGSIYVNGGGPNSGYLINVFGSDLYIESITNPKIVLGLNTRMEGIHIASDCQLVTDGGGVDQVVINESKTQEAINVLLQGEYPEVSIEATANVIINGNISLMTVLSNAGLTDIEMIDDSLMYFFACNGESVTIHGGTIIEAWINAEYCSLPEDTDQVNSRVGVAEVTVGEVTMSVLPTQEDQEQAQTEEQASGEEAAGETNDTDAEASDATDTESEDSASSSETEPQDAGDTNEAETEPQDAGDTNEAETEPQDAGDTNETETEPQDSSDADSDSENENDSQEGETESRPSDNYVDANVPMLTRNGQNMTLNIVVNEPCTIYCLVEAPNVLAMATTAENVRDGISAGAGMTMEDGMTYQVIHKVFSANQVQMDLSFPIDMSDLLPPMDSQDGPPEDDMQQDGGLPGLLVVIEDQDGNLTQVYVFQ